MLEGSVKWLSETCGSNSFGRQWAAGRQPPGGYNVYNYMAFLHFTYPYPDYFVTAGAPTLRGHCSHHVPQAVVMRQHTMPLFWRMLHRAATSCTRQAARSKRSKRSEPSACPIPPCIPPARAATALPIIPSAWSGPVHLSHTATRSRRSQASASQYPVSCRLPADSCFRLVLHAERSP